MTATPVRLPDAASVADVLAALVPETADAALAPALSQAFAGFTFTIAAIDDFYWRDNRTVLTADGTRIGDHRAFVERELAALGGDLDAFWNRYRSGEVQFTEWRGGRAFAAAATGPGIADFVQIALNRESEFLAGPIVDPHYRPFSAERLFEPSWVKRDPTHVEPPLIGPVYRLIGAGGIVHMKSFLARYARLERENREARRSEVEDRVIRLIGPGGTREIPFLEAHPDWFAELPRENRFFADWERSSAAGARIFVYWAFEVHDFEERGQRTVGFTPRPLQVPAKRLLADEAPSVHQLMERVEAIDEEIGLPFAWFFLMTHGQWVDPDVGHAIAAGLRAGRMRLAPADAAVLLAWADKPYLF